MSSTPDDGDLVSPAPKLPVPDDVADAVRTLLRCAGDDPDREGLLYAGTEFGIYISFDNGAHWQPFQLNLPQVPITDIKEHHKDLVVTTQ